MITSLSGANAYKNQLKLQEGLMDTVNGDDQSGKSSFSQLLENNLSDTTSSLKNAESLKMDALTGKADVSELVTAIANAEMALNTIVTVRDRAISAYQDIIRMPI